MVTPSGSATHHGQLSTRSVLDKKWEHRGWPRVGAELTQELNQAGAAYPTLNQTNLPTGAMEPKSALPSNPRERVDCCWRGHPATLHGSAANAVIQDFMRRPVSASVSGLETVLRRIDAPRNFHAGMHGGKDNGSRRERADRVMGDRHQAGSHAPPVHPAADPVCVVSVVCVMPGVSRGVDTNCDARGTVRHLPNTLAASLPSIRAAGDVGTVCASVLPIGNCVRRAI